MYLGYVISYSDLGVKEWNHVPKPWGWEASGISKVTISLRRWFSRFRNHPDKNKNHQNFNPFVSKFFLAWKMINSQYERIRFPLKNLRPFRHLTPTAYLLLTLAGCLCDKNLVSISKLGFSHLSLSNIRKIENRPPRAKFLRSCFWKIVISIKGVKIKLRIKSKKIAVD